MSTEIKNTNADAAIKRPTDGPFSSYQWFYVIDGRPECNGIEAFKYLKSVGFSTEEAGAYLRTLQGPETTIPMPSEEERYFQL